MSGRGTVLTFTINEQPYHPEVPPPYNVAVVVLDEQDDLRLVTNIVNCPLDELRIGMAVHVVFEPNGEIWVPLFEPVP